MGDEPIYLPQNTIPGEHEVEREWKTAHIFRNSAFVKLWIGQLLGLPALHGLLFAMIIQVYALSGSNGLVGTLMAVISIPPILFSSLGGVLADHINRKTLMVVSNAARLVAAIFLLLWIDSVTAILFFSFAVASMTYFFQPAENSSIPSIVGKKHLMLGNSIYMFTFYIAMFVGYTIAGPALEWIGVEQFMIVVIALFACATITDLTLPKLSETRWKRVQGRGLELKATLKQTWHGMKEGVNAMRGHRALQLTVLQLLLIFNIERGIIALVPDLTLNYFDMSVAELSLYLIGPLGVGAALATVVANKITKTFAKRRIVNMGMLLNSIFLLVLPFVAFSSAIVGEGAEKPFKITVLILLSLVAGFADILIMITAQTLLHEQAADDMRGRVVGNLFALMNAFGVPVILLVGWLTHYISAPSVIFALGIVTVIVWQYCARASRRDFEQPATAQAHAASPKTP